MISDDHFKKGAYTAALLAVGWFAFSSSVTAPLRTASRGFTKDIKQVQALMRTEGAELKALQERQEREKVLLAETRLAQRIEKSSPKRPWVDFPTIFNRSLTKHGVGLVYSNLSMILPFKGAEDLVQQTWLVRAPGAPAFGFSAAMAELEGQFPMAQITELSLTATEGGRVDATASFQVGVKP